MTIKKVEMTLGQEDVAVAVENLVTAVYESGRDMDEVIVAVAEACRRGDKLMARDVGTIALNLFLVSVHATKYHGKSCLSVDETAQFGLHMHGRVYAFVDKHAEKED